MSTSVGERPLPTPSSGRILVVDDEPNIRAVLEAILERAGFEVVTAVDGVAAWELIESEDFDCVVTDLTMPRMGGMELLTRVQGELPELPIIMITAYGTIESAVNALKRGAYDFVAKPFDQAELLGVVRKAARTMQSRRAEPSSRFVAGKLINQSPEMREIAKVIDKIAAKPSTVLITGESGTGKELVAAEIHRRSDRAARAFIKINCAAIPPGLIESELFGHEKGAFTGAVSARPGRFELAHQGTLFLDEVAEMPLEMQVKLLRVLQEQRFERVGGVQTLQVDVRIITATNRDVQTEVQAGRFREDLYYRLNVVPIHIPPLRARPDDLRALLTLFFEQFNQRLAKGLQGMRPEVARALMGYAWPGNIRQLENVIERMVLMSEGEWIELGDLPDEVLGERALQARQSAASLEGAASDSANLKQVVRAQTQRLERELIERALGERGGNITRTAEALGLSRKGLQLKMKELGIRPPTRGVST